MFGHVYKEHGNGLHPPSALVFKNLRVDWFMRAGGRPASGRGHGRFGSRGGRSGRSGGEDPFDETEWDGADDLDENMADGDKNRKRGVDGKEDLGIAMGDAGALRERDGELLGLPASLCGALVVPPSPPLKCDPKRTRTNAKPGANKQPPSWEEGDFSQHSFIFSFLLLPCTQLS